MKIQIFKNVKREGKNDPDYTGKISDESGKVLHLVSLWENTSKAGTKYLNGYVNEPRQTTPENNGN